MSWVQTEEKTKPDERGGERLVIVAEDIRASDGAFVEPSWSRSRHGMKIVLYDFVQLQCAQPKTRSKCGVNGGDSNKKLCGQHFQARVVAPPCMTSPRRIP